MGELSFSGIREFGAELALNSEEAGQSRLFAMHQFQRSIMKTNPEHAALLDIYEYLDETWEPWLKNVFDGMGNPNRSPTDEWSGEMEQQYKAKIWDGINQYMPSTIQGTAQKGWHVALVYQALQAMPIEGSEGKYKDINRALPKVLERLYGYWGKTFTTDGPIKVALPRRLINQYDVDQDDYDESLHYTYGKALEKFDYKLSVVAREGEVPNAYGFKSLVDDDEFAKGIEGKKEKPDGSKYVGTNRYQADWNKITQGYVSKGGNIWVSRINDSDDPSRIRLVIMAGNRDYMTDVKIIGDVYGIDKKTGESIPVTFSAEEIVKMMASRQAWQVMDSDDDWWDGQYWDWFTGIARTIGSLVGAGEAVHISTGIDRNRWSEAGGDFSRENVDYYHKKFSKDVPGSDYHKLPAHAIGGQWLTEWSNPGRVEMEMYIDPLFREIETYEKMKTEQTGKPYKINNEEFVNFFYLIKNGLNGPSGWFTSQTPMTYFDSIFALNPQTSLEELQQRPFKLQSLFEAVHD